MVAAAGAFLRAASGESAVPAFSRAHEEILESVYTEEVFVPIIDATGERLKPEVQARAGFMQNSPERAIQSLEQTLQAFREHIKKRREFLLAQDEIKNSRQVFEERTLSIRDPKTVRECPSKDRE